MTDVQICNLALLRLGEPEITALNATDRASKLCNAYYAHTVQEVLRGHRWNFATKRAILKAAMVTPSGIADSGGKFSVTKTSHGLTTGERVTFASSSNYPQIAGTWRITVVDTNTFTLDSSTFSGSGAVDTTYSLAGLFGWAYSIALPSDCLRALEDDRAEDKFATSWTVESGRVLTNTAELEFSYIEDVTDESRFDPLFIEALTLKLAVKLAAGLRGDTALSGALAQEYVALIGPLARRIDANEGQTRERMFPTQSHAIRARGRGVSVGCSTCDCWP